MGLPSSVTGLGALALVHEAGEGLGSKPCSTVPPEQHPAQEHHVHELPTEVK